MVLSEWEADTTTTTKINTNTNTTDKDKDTTPTNTNNTTPNTNTHAHATRAMKFMKVCNLPGLKETRAVKSQKWRKCGSVGCVVYTSTKLDDVPFADTFLVDDVLFIKAIDKNHVSIEAYMEVKFVKSTMMK